jgi:hypothetical protein
MTAPTVIVKKPIPRVAYIGFPCRRDPTVPPVTSTSAMCVFSSTQCAGTTARSKTMLFEPLPIRPMSSPQSSRIVYALRGATNISGGPGGPPFSAGSGNACPT